MDTAKASGIGPRILIADDERPLRLALERFVKSLGMIPLCATCGTEALDRLGECDLLLSDVKMPGLDGMGLLAQAKQRYPGLPVILLTGHGSIQMAVEAMRVGAANFISKPFDLFELEQVIRAALEQRGIPLPAARPAPTRRTESVVAGAARGGTAGTTTDLLGNSETMRGLRELVSRVAASEATVLISGESGSGKEVVARSVHSQSRRARGPFVAVNCAAVPETLLESELFGHVKGAFTGAVSTRPGRFAMSQEGTLLLDEIGELPIAMQVKLLRVLQERTYTPVGGTESRPADVRVLAATNRDTEAMVAVGSFRQDLFFRLNVLQIAVPPLRERDDDVVLLARRFLTRAAAAEGRGPMDMDEDFVLCLRRYAWPGNVRELEHAVMRAAVLAEGDLLGLADLPPQVRSAYAAPVRTQPPAAVAAI
ncbi:MAG: sigma-54 dependent transcriptional regulator, partial [Pseudomonadota bacterium]